MDGPGQDEPDDLLQQLRQAIEQSDLSVYEIAKRSGVDRPNLGRFVKGERSLTLESAAAVCKVLRLRLTKAQTGEGGQEAPPALAPEPTPTVPVPEPQAETSPQPRARRKRDKA